MKKTREVTYYKVYNRFSYASHLETERDRYAAEEYWPGSVVNDWIHEIMMDTDMPDATITIKMEVE